MHLLGISLYPVRWKRFLWFVSLLDIIVILEGIGTLVWFMADPSEPGSRFFLVYSLERWILIFISIAMIFGFSIVLWAIKVRTGWVEGIIKFFEEAKHVNGLLVCATILFVLAAGLMVWLPRNEVVKPYFVKLLPLFLWVVVIVTQVWAVLVVLMWKAVSTAINHFFPVSVEKQIYPLTTANNWLFLVLLGISFFCLVLQIRSYLAVREAILIGDSWSYLYGASLDLSDPAFFSERRPWASLLFYKILGSSQTAIEIFQLSISTLAWLWLAWMFARSIKNHWVKLIGFSVIIGFSLSPTVQLWNHTVLSESLTVSLMILILTVFIQLSQQWKWRYLLWLILFFVFWMSFREANAYVALFVAFVLLIMGLARRTFRAYWLLSFFIGVTFLVNYQLSSAYGLPRWALPLAEVITHRILPEREYLEFFSDHGMPVTSELIALSGRNANSDDFAIINNDKLKMFLRWLFNDGRRVYIKFLIAHPSYTVESPLADIKSLLGYNYFDGFLIPNYSPALPSQINELLYPVRWFWLYLWLSLFAAGFVCAANLRTKRGVYWIIVIFLLLAIPQLYLVWHADALDVERHAVVANIQFHLGIWALIALWLDGIFKNPVTADLAGS